MYPKLEKDTYALMLQMTEQGYIHSQQHPTEPLYIYNYSPQAQFERAWNEATLISRGLILTDRQEIVARPFAKFFNLEENQPQPIPFHEPFEVYEKMDGSLGILYYWKGEWQVATRGSFQSEQALIAKDVLYKKYSHTLGYLKPAYTYLVEIIYPSNRIVVDYGKQEDLVLLAVIDNYTGLDVGLSDIGFPIVKRYDGINDIHQLKQLEEENREGFVVKFESGYRVKIKFEEYTRLHYIITQVSTKTIWEALKNDIDLKEIVENVPDEFYDWVKKTVRELKADFKKIEDICKSEFKILPTRKECAAYFKTCTHPDILFKMLDNKDYTQVIWRMVEPPFSKPFTKVKD